ncbi:MAG: MBL fold metallo-hydrolase [Pyrinomonadaceae bacterium]|nr:MBL fold metallo-hydrolase [Phycisphaerales bacterium]
MNFSRREFVSLSSVAAFGLVATNSRLLGAVPHPRSRQAIAADPTYFEWKPIGATAWVGMGEGGNTLIVASKGELLLVDTKFAAFAPALRREAEAAATSPSAAKLKYVINTHHHGDHTGGNHAFSGDLPIIAQEKSKARIIAQLESYKKQARNGVAQLGRSDKPAAKSLLEEAGKLADNSDSMKPEQFAPTKTFDKDHEFKTGEQNIMLHHYGAGHTDNDAVVHVPSLNILATGDLLFHAMHPYMDVGAGSNSTGWIASCRKAAELCNDKTIVVPGHGAITDKAGLLKQITYFETVLAAVKHAVEAGTSKQDVLKLPLDEFKDYGATERRGMVLGALFDELKPAK